MRAAAALCTWPGTEFNSGRTPPWLSVLVRHTTELFSRTAAWPLGEISVTDRPIYPCFSIWTGLVADLQLGIKWRRRGVPYNRSLNKYSSLTGVDIGSSVGVVSFWVDQRLNQLFRFRWWVDCGGTTILTISDRHPRYGNWFLLLPAGEPLIIDFIVTLIVLQQTIRKSW